MLAWVVQVLNCWRGQLGRCLVLDVWRIAPLCLMLSLWREWNARCCEDCETAREELKNVVFKLLLSWTMVYDIYQFSNF
jgi:hypothetical protein